ncbi:MAG: transglycosylase SLT domain-containing protein [Bacteriovoracaceae bacterium]
MIRIIGLTLVLASCSTTKMFTKNQNEEQVQKESKEVQHLIQTNKGVSEIIGSSDIDANGKSKQKSYYLFGAEHLNLDNYYFDIPVVYNDQVKKWLNYFLNRGRGFFERYSQRAGRYAPLLSEILAEYGLPRDLIFLAMAESGFQNNAKSWAKAVGPWQFMPYTGKRFGLHIDWYTDERRDPIKATIAAAKYLKRLYQDFESWELAAAAYNAGEGKISRAISRYKTENFWRLTHGRYLKRETKNYVPKIMALAIIGKNLRSFGFGDIDFHEPLDFEEIQIAGGTDLIELAKELELEYKEVRRLNPEVMRWFVSPKVEKYYLRVPKGFKQKFTQCCVQKDLKAAAFQSYHIRGRRATLRDVARKFKLKSYVLEDLNGMGAHNVLKKGKGVVLPFRLGQSKRDRMYADLYEKPRKSVVRRRKYRSRIKLAQRRGELIRKPTAYYTVKKGDTLWDVSRKTGTSLDTLIRSNLSVVKNRMIRAGDKLVIK